MGKHRHPMTLRLTSVIALVVALIATGVMLLSKPVEHGPAASAAEVTLEQAYPGRKPKPVKATLADGTTFTPAYFVDAQRLLGTTRPRRARRTSCCGHRRESACCAASPTRKPPSSPASPALQQRVVWLELTATAEGLTETRLWTIDSESAAPRMVTADTGDVALFDKRDDVVIHDGLVTWVAAARTETPVTEIRTVSVNGRRGVGRAARRGLPAGRVALAEQREHRRRRAHRAAQPRNRRAHWSSGRNRVS